MIKTKVATAVATGALFLSVMAPAAFAESVTVSGNGTGSSSTVTISHSSNCNVTQSNDTLVTTDISATAKTGNNHANDNTNGDVLIQTGDASNSATVTVAGSSNSATNPCCGCSVAANDVLVSGNGSNTSNNVSLSHSSLQNHTQTNLSTILSSLALKAKTGKNRANGNTGPGAVGIGTGSAANTAGVSVGGSTNALNP